MRRFGLIGYPLAHSFSKQYFEEKFKKENIRNCSYDLFEIKDVEEFPRFLSQNPDIKGLNVTIPYKEKIIHFLDVLDQSAQAVGAVNTVAVVRSSEPGVKNYELIGYNTDVCGFQNSLKPLLQPQHKQALILGTGGAAKAVAFALKTLSIQYQYVSRTPKEQQISYRELTPALINRHKLIINATPVGTYPDIQAYPNLPYKYLTPLHLLFDLVYNPGQTLFLKKGAEQGAVTKNGLEMLHLQAEKAWEIWNS